MPRRKIPAQIDRQIRKLAKNRCGYCLSPQHLVMARLEIEHIFPIAKGGSNDESNLWLCCPICNRHKSDKIEAIDPQSGQSEPLFNPRLQNWLEHFEWIEGGLRIMGKPPTWRATVIALQLSHDPDALMVRSYWIQVGWHPPQN